MRVATVFLTAAALCVVSTAFGGPAVRVTPLRGRSWEGELVAMRDQVLELRREGEPLFVQLRDVRRIEFLAARAEAPVHDRALVEELRSGLLARSPLEMLEYARNKIGEDRELGLAVTRALRQGLRTEDSDAEERRRTRFALVAVTASFGGRRAAVVNALDQLEEMHPEDEEVEGFRERVEEAWRRQRDRRGGGGQP